MNAERMMREPRTRLSGGLQYRYEPESQGTARWVNVSRVGAALHLGRYLRPGRYLQLRFASPLREGAQEEVSARVMWCRQVPGTVEFMAGVRVLRDRPETAVAFAAIGYQAQAASARAARRDASCGPECAEANKDACHGVVSPERSGSRSAREVSVEPNAATLLARAV